jgi:hypothetical protein
VTTQTCALCGFRPATTREHVPSKSLFPQPRPDDLITVPACASCNQGTQKEDEYFRKTLALIVEQEPSAALEKIRPTVTRAFARPEEALLLKEFAERFQFAALEGRTVVQPVIKPDSRRLNNVVGKHAVGLYYAIIGRHLPPSWGMIVLPLRWIDKIPQEDRSHWEQVWVASAGGVRRSVGDGGVFRFALRVADDNPHGFVATIHYFKNFAYVVRSYERPTAQTT